MTSQALIKSATVLRISSLPERLPDATGKKRIVLFIGNDGGLRGFSEQQARRLIDGGASFICCWGARADEFEETFDYAAFLPECGPELTYTLMTTSHSNESFEDAVCFAFNLTRGPDLDADFDHLVVLVDSADLVARFNAWLESNTK